MATSAVSYRKTNGHSNTDSYQMYIEVYETGNISGTQKQIHIRLWGYAKSPGGYTGYSRPYAYTDYNSRQVRDWWPRDTWIILVEHYVYVEGGQTHTFEGSYNSNDTTSYMPLKGDWSVSVNLYVNPVFEASTISSSSVLPAKIYAGQTITYSMNVSSFNPGVNASGSYTFVLRWINPAENIWIDGGKTSAGSTGNRSYTIPSNAAGKTLRTFVEHAHRKSYGAEISYDATGIQDRVVGSYVQVQNPQVTDITATGCKVSMSSSNPSDTDRSHYSIYDDTKTIRVLNTEGKTPPIYEHTFASGLQPNTEYYARFDLRTEGSQTWDPRGAQWVKFQTHPNTVAVVNPEVTNIGFDSCTLSMSSSDPANTDRSSYAIYASDQTTRIQGHFDDTPAVYSKNITGLEPNTTYYARFALRTERSNAWSTIQWVDFKTFAADDFCKLVYSNGTVSDAKKMYAISGKNILDVRGLVEQGELKGVVGYTFEQNKSVSTTRCRCNISTALRLIPGNTYTLTVPNGYRVGLHHYDSNELCLGDSGWLQGTYTFTVPSNNYSYTTYVVSNGAITGEEDLLTVEMANQLSGFQLELGDIATQYEPFIKEITRNKLHLIE